ncbi:MAG TPA: hypothetical protein VGE50_00875 [Gammaproteobacteria bacterium]
MNHAGMHQIHTIKRRAMTGWFKRHKSANGPFNFVPKTDEDHDLLGGER